MDDITKFTGEYGLTIGIIIWTAYGILKLAEKFGPEVWSFYKKSAEEERVSKQQLQTAEFKQEQLQLLIAQGSRTFTEEQITMMTAETQTQLSEANEFIRKDVADKLDAIIQQLISLKERIDRLPLVFGEKYKQEFSENTRLRTNIRMIAYILEREFKDKYIVLSEESENERSESSRKPEDTH